MFSKLKIAQKLWLLTIGIILILSSGFYFYFTTVVENQFKEGLIKKGVGLVQTAAANLGAGLYFNESKFLHNILKGLENDPDIAFIYVTDNRKAMQYGYHYSQYLPIIKPFLDSNRIQKYVGDFLLVKQSIFFYDEFQGNIVVGFNMKWVKDNVARQTRNLLAINIFLILFLIVLSSFLARAISNPIQEAARAIDHFSEKDGSLNLRLPVKGRDEIAQLATAFNRLADRLDSNLRELNESKTYLETLFQLSPIPILIADTMGKIEGVNESASAFFQIEPEVLLKMNLDRFFQQEDLNAITNRIVQDKQDIRGYVTTLKMTDGSKRIVELNIASHKSDLNYIKNIIIAIIDITEKIQIQREILKNQTKLQRINNELVQKTTELERLSAWNKKNAQKLGQLIQLSQKMMRAVTPDEMMQILVKNAPELMEADESVIYLWNASHKQLVAVAASPQNLVERISKRVEESDNFIWSTYHRNEALVLNSSELKREERALLGVTKKDSFSLIAVPITEKEYRFGVILLLKERQHTFRTEDVHLLTTMANQAAILLDNMHLVQALKEKAVTLEKAYSDLQQSQQQVIQLQKMKSLGTLVGGIAHDFNNILGIIIPNADLLRNETQGNGKVIRRINIISEAAQRAADLTRQLLLFSRNQDIDVKQLSPNQLITHISSMLRRTLGKEYEIIADLLPDIDDIEADETRLSQVLVNLAVNARDAMPEGGKITFRTRMRKYRPKTEPDIPEREYVCISITDTGCGIKSEDLDKIFDPFFTTKSVGKGTGLGLSVVYGIMQSHDGYVDVESEEGKGTTFYLYLPPVPRKEQVAPVSDTKSIPQGTERILVIDDEKMIRVSVKEILESLGYSVETASSGPEGIKMIRQNTHHFHLAIVDMYMPKMNGLETIRRIRELDGSVKVILSSGRIDEGKKRPTDVKIDGSLPKPYRMRELALKVRQVLNSRL